GVLYLEYRVSGAPVGLMVLAKSSPNASVCLLVTHPGSDHAGGIMMEVAVQQSVDWGTNGKLMLTANDEEYAQAYEKMGFDSEGGSMMYLDPSNSKVWKQVGPTWKLAKYVGLSYRG